MTIILLCMLSGVAVSSYTYEPSEEFKEGFHKSLQEIEKTSRFFTPCDPRIFQRWRSEYLLEKSPDLYYLSDPSWYHLPSIMANLYSLLIPPHMHRLITEVVPDPFDRLPLDRALFNLRILSDLNMVRGDSAVGERFQLIRKSLDDAPRFDSHLLIMSFRMALPRCPSVWDSLGSITRENEINRSQIARWIAEIGEKTTADWFFTMLGLIDLFPLNQG